jgi:tRNA-specific 2-thiouridylase
MLQRSGHELVGLFMRNGVHVDAADSHKKSCCSVSDARDARMVAAALGIPFQAVDLKQEFGEIIRYFLKEYARGRTPNPCAICNRDLKFNRLLSFADELGAQFVATGHYARLDLEKGRVRVRRGVDHSKDQSYQLFSVAERHLARAKLPLGALQKSEVRAMASEAGLRTAAKADSQEICFVPSNDYRLLLEQRGVARGRNSARVSPKLSQPQAPDHAAAVRCRPETVHSPGARRGRRARRAAGSCVGARSTVATFL